MEVQQKHIAYRIVSALIVLVLLIPTGIKLAHIFEHQDHPLCEKTDTANFHECEVDCPFLEYNLQQYDVRSENFEVGFHVFNNFHIPTLVHDALHNHRVLSFSLRGPPVLV